MATSSQAIIKTSIPYKQSPRSRMDLYRHRSPKKLPKHPNQAIQTPNHSKKKITVLECETTIYQCKRNQASLERRRDEPLKDHRRQGLQNTYDAIAMVHQSIGRI
jgi:hypothetical protein